MSAMRIVLVCQKCEKVEDGFVGTFTHLKGSPLISVKMEVPMVPGDKYELRLVGIYPGSCDNRQCSSDMLEFNASSNLTAVNVYEELRKEQEQVAT